MYASVSAREELEMESIHEDDGKVHFHFSTNIYLSMSIHEARLVNVALSEVLQNAHHESNR